MKNKTKIVLNFYTSIILPIQLYLEKPNGNVQTLLKLYYGYKISKLSKVKKFSVSRIIKKF